jgi:hypothetical protein
MFLEARPAHDLDCYWRSKAHAICEFKKNNYSSYHLCYRGIECAYWTLEVSYNMNSNTIWNHLHF